MGEGILELAGGILELAALLVYQAEVVVGLCRQLIAREQRVVNPDGPGKITCLLKRERLCEIGRPAGLGHGPYGRSPGKRSCGQPARDDQGRDDKARQADPADSARLKSQAGENSSRPRACCGRNAARSGTSRPEGIEELTHGCARYACGGETGGVCESPRPR